ncbi:hypothetical protein BST45_13365 [Mycobacterium shinjukuense]|nr:hypothetical protein BST45_13365 [Mycobacterium shinjukuense]
MWPCWHEAPFRESAMCPIASMVIILGLAQQHPSAAASIQERKMADGIDLNDFFAEAKRFFAYAPS